MWKTNLLGGILTSLKFGDYAYMGIDTPKEELIKIWHEALLYIEKALNDTQVYEAYFDETKLISLTETVAEYINIGFIALGLDTANKAALNASKLDFPLT